MPKKPLIVLHGLLGSKSNWKGICNHINIVQKRDCYLLEMRNHVASDHHQDHTYDILADDVIRFCDKNGFDKFTVMGHSMGGRTSLVLAAKYPDRVDGVISIDAAPVDERGA